MTMTYVGTVGLKVRINTKNDLSGTTLVALLVKKPDGTEVTWEGTANGTYIEYVVQDGDLDQAGYYAIQAYFERADGSKFYGNTTGIHVYEKFE